VIPLNNIKIYLAGACHCESDEGKAWRDKAKSILKTAAEWANASVETINPLDYFSYSENKHKSNKQVKNFYMSKIKTCDLVLVNLKNSALSCGTCMEVQFAVDHEIPVIGFDNENAYPWVSEVDCDVIFNNLLEAVDYIRDYYMKSYG
jgi:nucleoside 2-deoxyribosyltransferase